MDVTIRSGTVSPSSLLPRLVDLKPGLIDPTKFRIEDAFTQTPTSTPGRSTLNGSSPDYANAAQTWVTSGTWTLTPGTDGGYISGASLTGVLDIGSSPVKLMARIKWGVASSFAAILARYVDGNNYIRLSLSSSLGVLLEKRVAGVTTTIVNSAKTLTIGQTYLLTLTIVGDVLTAYVDNIQIFSVTDAALSGNTKGGIMGGNASHLIKYFGAGAV